MEQRGVTMTERVGFIGLGIMGRGMARNLLKAGFEPRVWNRTASRMADLAAEGAMPVVQAMGKTIIHVGGTSAGQTVKLVNQILVVGNMLAAAEALLFAQAGGVDLQKALAAVVGGAAGSWMLSNRGPQVLKRDWRPGFTIDLQQKDIRLVLSAADQLGAPLPGTALIFQLYRTLQAQGLGAEGNHALIKALEHLAGFEVGAA